MKLLPIIAVLALSCAAVEALAYWWMHPAPADQHQPVLAYRPKVKAETLKTEMLKEDAQTSAQGTSSSSSSISASQLLSVSASSSYTPLPEVVARAIPSLHCSTGTAARIDRDDGATIHLAFFEWDQASSTNVLEAYKHLPEECMGSIGMTLISKEKPRSYVVKSQKSKVESQSEKEANAHAQSTSSTSDLRPSTFDSSSSTHSKSKIQNSKLATRSLLFDHTIFRDPAGVIVHAFKGTWVSGADGLLGDGLRGGAEQWNQLRWKSALKRFRPAHARVVQGAVRGIPNPNRAWEAFEQAMLVDLCFAQEF